MRSRGFTLVDLAVVIGVIGILAAVIVPSVLRSIELAKRASCTAKLKGVGTAVAMFRGEDEKAKFPLLFTAGRPEANIRRSDGSKNLDELKRKLVGREAAMQNVWPLIIGGVVTEDAFGCPSDKDLVSREFEDKTERRNSKIGWRSSAEFSYGMHFPYRSTTVNGEAIDNPAYLGSRFPHESTAGGSETIDNPAYLGPHLRGSFAIMADKNPSRTNEPAKVVGPNHPNSNHRDGPSVLMYSGQVNWWEAGSEHSKVNDDDIYTIQKKNNANLATPANENDTYITRHPIDE